MKEGTVKLPRIDYDYFQDIKTRWFMLMELCDKAVAEKDKRRAEQLHDGNSYISEDVYISIDEICAITGWASADINHANYEEIMRIKKTRDENRGEQE